MQAAKRFKPSTEKVSKDCQLSGLFNIIANNLLTATEVLGTGHRLETVQELELVSKKARSITKEILTNHQNKDGLNERVLGLKEKMLELINDLSLELNKLDPSKNKDKRAIENLILARRLLRESQRGLSTL